SDPQRIVNLSVWSSPEALFDFVYKSAHRALMVRRREWFEKPKEAHQALWWIPSGHIPTTTEAMERLAHLRRHGPTPEAFTFKQRFAPPGTGANPGGLEPEPYCAGWV
ncbi:MAG TPA: DUF3291 domain-containing protein, partial [Polyangiaceae bacterium]|nr:DUF3291 domain-containing protein [Polyangiaceae bacterium]